ncbi:MAG: LacI family DNA-binding transcriptional regulator [Actinobacteria bacterium]|nr:LacI family DNA-binding transcriptional regulator [Actinomycetota bacterium]
MKNITIKKIAELAGVSHKTVSRVVNNEKHVKEETKNKVLKIIKEYKYEPNYFAIGLKTRKSKTIGLIVGDIENPYYARLAKGVINICESSNYNVIVCNSQYNNELSEKYLKMLISKGVDGLIISNIDLSVDSVKTLIKRNIPIVFTNIKYEIPGINYIKADDYHGGRLAAEYLTKLGHRKIFFLRPPDVYGAQERINAFKDTMTENSIYFDDTYFSDFVFDEESSYRAAREFISNQKDFTAIIAGNDFIAMGAMEAVFDLGFRVPDDFSIIGYDNLKIAKIMRVPLTTIKQPKYLFGKMAAGKIIEMINNPDTNMDKKEIVIKPELVERMSCKNIN